MNYQSLIYFKVTAELQHFTRAANTLHISQPALSKAIHNLEKELGAHLFEKEGRNAILTKCGKLFYTYVEAAISEINVGMKAVKHLAASQQNTIVISALTSTFHDLMPTVIHQFRKLNENCQFSVEYKYTSAIIQDILQGKSDFGICSDINKSNTDYAFLDMNLIRRERLMLIAGPNHHLVQKKNILIEELANEQFFVYINSDHGSNIILRNLCHKAGFKPKIIEAFNDFNLFTQVSTGEGISFVSEYSPFFVSDVIELDLSNCGFKPYINLYLVWKKSSELSTISQSFLKFMLSYSEW